MTHTSSSHTPTYVWQEYQEQIEDMCSNKGNTQEDNISYKKADIKYLCKP